MIGFLRLGITLAFPVTLCVLATERTLSIANAVSAWLTVFLLYIRLHWAHFDQRVERFCAVCGLALNLVLLSLNCIDYSTHQTNDIVVAIAWSTIVLVVGISLRCISPRCIPAPLPFFRL